MLAFFVRISTKVALDSLSRVLFELIKASNAILRWLIASIVLGKVARFVLVAYHHANDHDCSLLLHDAAMPNPKLTQRCAPQQLPWTLICDEVIAITFWKSRRVSNKAATNLSIKTEV